MTTRRAIIDACVLANFSLCDTLLRCAEPPELIEPGWPDQIIVETTRTLESKLHWPKALIASFERELRAHFASAWFRDYEYFASNKRLSWLNWNNRPPNEGDH